MNFAVAWQNSFVWFIAHTCTHEILVCTCFLWYSDNNGMMKDSLQNSFQGDNFETQMNRFDFCSVAKQITHGNLYWIRLIYNDALNEENLPQLYKIQIHPKLHWMLNLLWHYGAAWVIVQCTTPVLSTFLPLQLSRHLTCVANTVKPSKNLPNKSRFRVKYSI